MNSKPTILVNENRTVFQVPFLEDYWQPYFNIEIIDINKTYDKHSTVFVSDWRDFDFNRDENEKLLASKGIRHVIDHCPDSWDCSYDNRADFTLRPIDYYQILESIWYRDLGYDKLELSSNPTRDFLLLMNLKKPWRTQLYNRLKPVLANNIYSYVEHGIPLQNAKDLEWNNTTWQRYIDPNWYTDTRFSIVSESSVHNKNKFNDADLINVTEKTLKPCAFKHPSIVWGQAGTLAWQKRQGFETFEHCIDESYDTIEDQDTRFDRVIEQIEYCIKDKTIFRDPLTQQKLEHNYNHFYNEEIVMKLFREQMVYPLLEFINA